MVGPGTSALGSGSKLAMSFVLAYTAAPYTREELLEFTASLSLSSLSAWTLSTYWPSAIVLAVCSLLIARSRNAGWFVLPVLSLSLQQSLRVLGLLNDGFPHILWLVRELWSACLAFVFLAMAVSLHLALDRGCRISHSERLFLGISLVAAFTVFLDWAFLLFVASPLGATAG